MNPRTVVWRVKVSDFTAQLEINGIDPHSLTVPELAVLQWERGENVAVQFALATAVAEAAKAIADLRARRPAPSPPELRPPDGDHDGGAEE